MNSKIMRPTNDDDGRFSQQKIAINDFVTVLDAYAGQDKTAIRYRQTSKGFKEAAESAQKDRLKRSFTNLSKK